MKKHLIAAAVAAAVAVPAMAQVTISGRIDTSVGKATNKSDAGSTRVQSSVITSNQIVISGSEDLGGGLKASFSMITGFASDASNETTVVNASDTANNGSASTFRLGDRGMEVGVSGAFGSVSVGRTSGTMLNSTTASGLTGNIGNLSTLVARPDNMVSYTLPTINGFTGRLVYGAGTEVAGGSKDKQSEVSLQYANGPLLVRLAQAKYRDADVKVPRASSNIFGTSSSSPSAAYTDDQITENGAQINYAAGFATVNLRIQNREHSAANLVKDFDSYGVGAAFDIGNGLTLSVDFVDTDVNEANKDSDVTSATIVKGLSKRTNVYFAAARKTYELTTDKDEQLYAVGVRHSF